MHAILKHRILSRFKAEVLWCGTVVQCANGNLLGLITYNSVLVNNKGAYYEVRILHCTWASWLQVVLVFFLARTHGCAVENEKSKLEGGAYVL